MRVRACECACMRLFCVRVRACMHVIVCLLCTDACSRPVSLVGAMPSTETKAMMQLTVCYPPPTSEHYTLHKYLVTFVEIP